MTGEGRTGSAAASAPALPRATPTGALPLREVLATPILHRAEVVAGAAGLDRLVERLNVMEVPDILPWVKPDEFLLTTAYPLRESPDTLTRLIGDLDDAGLAGLGVKLGRYLGELPAGAIEIAEERGFPLVRLPDGVSFDEIFNEVLTGILNRQAQKLARSEQVHRVLIQLVLAGGGLDAITSELARLVDLPVLVVSTDGTVLSASGLQDDTRLEIDGGAIRRDGTVVDGVAVPISAGSRLYGHLVGLGRGADDRMVLESAATVAALSITKRMEVEAVEQKYQSDLVHDLLTGRADPTDARARARMFGWDLDRRLIVLVAQLDETTGPVLPDEDTRRLPLATTIRHLVLEHDPRAAIVRFSDEVVILTEAFGGDDGRTRARRFARSLSEEGSRPIGVSVSVGLSRPVTSLDAIPSAYGQATRALHIGRRLHGPGAAAHFDDLGVYRVLTLIEDVEELRSFSQETLGELADDTEAAEELRRTLEVLLETNLNVAAAARRLHFHYNTLRYRIEKLERILGPFTSDATTRLDVQVALLIQRMRSL